MNLILETIYQRRSVRRFTAELIPRNILETLIDAGNQAPTGSNAQPWRFVVIESAAARKRLAELALPIYRKWLATMPAGFQEMRQKVDAQIQDPVYYSAPAIVFVIGKKSGAGVFDCPMVCQNIMLAARSLELGSCWVFIGSLAAAESEVKTLLALQDDEQIYGPIVLGHPEGGFPDAHPKKPPMIVWR